MRIKEYYIIFIKFLFWKIKILNSTLRQFSGIYLCMNGFYSFTCQCYTFPAFLTAVEGGIP